MGTNFSCNFGTSWTFVFLLEITQGTVEMSTNSTWNQQSTLVTSVGQWEMPQIAWKWPRAARPGSKKPLTRRKTPVLQGGNRSTARRLKEPFAHHKLHPVNNSPALTDQSRPVVSAKYMEIINPFSKPGLSCMCQTRSSKDSWYVNLNNLSSRKMQLTLNHSSSKNNQISSQRKSRLNLFSLHPGGHKTCSGIPFLLACSCPSQRWELNCSLLAAQQITALNEVSG